MNQQSVRDGKHSLTRADTPVSTPPPTPTPAAAAAQDLYIKLRSIYQQLAPLQSLAPCDLVNALLTRLVALCIQPYSPEIVDHFYRIGAAAFLCQSLQNLCATAEGELERYWGDKILQNAGPHADSTHTRTFLTTFPYYKNYLSLSHLEASILNPFLTHAPSNIAFIGSGPLPLSSLCLLDHFPTATIHNIDRDADSLVISSELVEKLGYADRMTFACEDATDASGGRTKWESMDVVFLAALVGMRSSDKVGVLRVLSKMLRVGTIVVCRSARGMRGVLYPVLELSEELQNAGFDILAELHPWNDVVNSVVVLRVKA